jgi:exopolysaccharide/PEP-CTERM locus tyrosine autokinase
MSIIERAINKLSGDDTPVEAEVAPAQPVAPAAPEPVPAATAAVAPAEPVAPPRVATPNSVASPPGSFVPPPPDPKKSVYIDLDRLAAAGFLQLDGGNTRLDEDYQQVKRRLLGNTVPGMAPSNAPANLIMVTSSVPGEGKTFTSVNMALSLTKEVDHTILAIDTDIVKRDLSKAFGCVDQLGLYDVLSNPALEISDVMLRTNIPNLVVIPAGQDQSARTELLASVRMKAITEELATRYSDRLVLFDTSPILATSTALALAPQVGQFVLVVEANKTKHETLSAALDLLDDTPITGLILNKVKQSTRKSYDYYGYYTKGDDA